MQSMQRKSCKIVSRKAFLRSILLMRSYYILYISIVVVEKIDVLSKS